jgi:DinB family protein
VNETFEQYTARILSYVGTDAPLDILAATPGRLGSLIASAGDEHLRWSPAAGRWSIAEIVTHLADAEIVGAYRLRLIVAAPGIAVQAYDQNAWARELDYATSDPHVSLDVFRAVRAGQLDLVRRLSDDRLDRFGMHSERGRETVRHILRMYAGHDRNHLGQIERLLSESRARR